MTNCLIFYARKVGEVGMKEFIIPVDELTLEPDELEWFKKQGAKELVRCKICKYWLPMNRFHQDYHSGRGDCELNCWVRDSDWFCADGKRK